MAKGHEWGEDMGGEGTRVVEELRNIGGRG